MGIIRKTASIGTLGIISFRSKKELLRRAEKGKRAAEAELEREQTARSDADRRVSAAEKRLQKAELAALHEAQAAAKAKSKAKGGRGRRGKRDKGAIDRLSDFVATAQPVVEEHAKEAGRRARKAAKASRKASRKAADAATEAAHGIKDDLVDLTTTAADKIKDRAEAARR